MTAPWQDQPTPLVDSACPWKKWQIEIEAGEEYAALAEQSRAIEQRMRAAEALLADTRKDKALNLEDRWAWEKDVRAHLAAAKAMDGENGKDRHHE